MLLRHKPANEFGIQVDRCKRPVGSEEHFLVVIGIHQRPAEMVHEQRFIHESFKMGTIPHHKAGQIGIYVRILRHHFGGIHHPGITQMTDHEVHSSLLIS
ncbi:hypothetical protein D3C76_1517830 [compost metagenome]